MAAIDLLEGSETVELALAYSNRAQLRMLASDLEGTQDWGRRTLVRRAAARAGRARRCGCTR